MKLLTFFLFAASLFVSARPVAQTVTISGNELSLEEVFATIKKQTGHAFLYTENVLSGTKKISLHVSDSPLASVLSLVFKDQPLDYTIKGKTIFVFRKISFLPSNKIAILPSIPVTSLLNGRVQSLEGDPLRGITFSKSNSVLGVSDAEGRFSLRVNEGDVIRVSSVAFLGLIFRVLPAEQPEQSLRVQLIAPIKPITDKSEKDSSAVAAKVSYLQNTGSGLVIFLAPNVSSLDDVTITVNTGYQTLNRNQTTGAFDVVNRSTIDKKVVTNITEALEGQAPGVSTYQDKVVMRGVSTFSTSIGNEPLVVIDGLPTERSINDININDVETLTILKDAAASSIYGVRAANGVIVITTKGGKLQSRSKTTVQFISDWRWIQNPSLGDFHYANSEQVMGYELAHIQRSAINANLSEKDYLNQNLKGVGEAGVSSVSLPYYTPFRYARLQYLNGQLNEKDYNDLITKWQNTNYKQEYIDLLWRTPLRQSYNLAVNSSSQRQSTYVSLNYIGDNQRVTTNKDKYIKGYFKSTQQLNNWFSFDVGADVQYSKKVSADADYATFNTLEPYTSILDENGNRVYRDYVDIAGQHGSFHVNPKILDRIKGLPQFMPYSFNILDEIEDGKTTQNNYSLRSFVRLNFNIIKGLRLSTSVDYEFAKNKAETFQSDNSYYVRFLRNKFATSAAINSVIPAGARMSITDASTNSYVWRNQLDFNKTIHSDHQITTTAGFELRQLQSLLPNVSVYYGYNPTTLTYTQLNSYDIQNTGYKTSFIYNNNTGQAGAVIDGSSIRLSDSELKPTLSTYNNRYVGAYAVGGYTYKGRYGVTGSVRVDQTNLFGTDPKYRYRPLWSVGMRWSMSKENFMNHVSWVDMLDLRGSYGLTGNVDQTTTPYLVASVLNQSSYTSQTIQYTTITTAPNPLLRWEKTTSYNAGVDFSLFKGMLNGKLDYYLKISEDLLGTKEVPFTSGYTTQRVNSGAMKNNGIELALSSPWFKRNDLTLSSTLVAAYNRNRVTKTYFNPSQASHLAIGGYLVNGKPFASVYAYRFGGLTNDGTEQQNGVPIIERADGSTFHHYKTDGTLLLDASASMLPQDVIYMGAATPPVNASFTQNIAYRGWELSAMLIYYGGHKVYVPSFDFYQNAVANDMPDWIGSAWTPQNTNSSIPKSFVYYDPAVSVTNVSSLSGMYQRSTVNTKSGDFVRLRNVALSYSLLPKYTRFLKIEKLKITAQVNNPWLWSAAGKDIDGEKLFMSGTSTGSWQLPVPATYFLRFDLVF